MAPICVLFWFDVEDYITPQADDALQRLIEAFDAQGVRATWKLVGEKLRVLERRGRGDIIELLRRHDVGYHTDFHSRHPTVAEYLADQRWDEGVAEFAQRERPGYEDILRVFGRTPACYGQPGGSWASQVFPVLKEWGIPLYLDEGGHIGLDKRPFWYCGVLNVFRLRENCTQVSLGGGPETLQKAKQAFTSIAARLRSTGGVVSVYYHPCEFIHSRFWDGVNFARGANPPPEEWQPAPLKPQAEIEEGFRRFAQYLAFVRDQPGVEILTATEFVERSLDRAIEHWFTSQEIARLAEAMQEEITWCRAGEATISPAEVFGLVVDALVEHSEQGKLPEKLSARVGLLGPVEKAPAWAVEAQGAGGHCAVQDLLMACKGVRQGLDERGRLPSGVDVGRVSLTPPDFLATSATLLLALSAGHPWPEGERPGEVQIRRGKFTLDRCVGQGDLWSWVIFPPGFRGDRLLELARLQAWTLKPAVGFV